MREVSGDDAEEGTGSPRRERRSPRRRFRRLYHAATVAQLTDLAHRLRHDTVVGLHPGEQLVEDDAVLVAGVGRDARAEAGDHTRGGAGGGTSTGAASHGAGAHGRDDERWAWLLVTDERLRWIVLGDEPVGEAALSKLTLTRWSGHTDVLRWTDGDGSPMVMTLSFPSQSRARVLLVGALDAAGPPPSS